MKALCVLRFLRIATVWALFGVIVPPALADPAVSSEAKTERPASPSEAEAQLATALAGKEELFLAIRESAANLKPYQQLILAGDAARQREPIDRLADSRHIPTADELARLFGSLQDRLDALGRIETFRAPVYAPNGQAAEKDVLRLGGFTFLSEGRYLVYSPEVDRLIELPRQPPSNLLDRARKYARANTQTLAPVAIDPISGQTL